VAAGRSLDREQLGAPLVDARPVEASQVAATPSATN
jgi:hypothetical protein